MSRKENNVELPEVGLSGLRSDEVAPEVVQENVHVGMTTRSMTKGIEGNLMIEPEDSMSNIGSRVSGTSNLSEAQIEIQRQLETNQALANLSLARLAREEKAAELQAELAIKQAALKAEFLKKGLEQCFSK